MSDTITEQEYRRLKQDVEQSCADAERAKGRLDQLLAQLKQEFGCSSLKEAKALLANLDAQQDQAQRRYTKTLQEYEKKWKSQKPTDLES